MTQYGWEDCPRSVSAQIRDFADATTLLLNPNLVGIYLHGSLAMGCFNPHHSDIDLLVITRRPMELNIKWEVAQLLLLASFVPQPIEISFLAQADLVPWRFPTPFDFHYSETWRGTIQRQLQDGTWRQWNPETRCDPDLAAHVTITRQRGISLLGAPIADVFPDVPAADYLASILGDSRDTLDGPLDGPVYAILNACRVYAFMVEGRVCSKQEGGVWALATLPDDVRPAVETALYYYMNEVDDRWFDPAAVDRFVAYMREGLEL